jgi:hypothetical protein
MDRKLSPNATVLLDLKYRPWRAPLLRKYLSHGRLEVETVVGKYLDMELDAICRPLAYWPYSFVSQLRAMTQADRVKRAQAERWLRRGEPEF